MSILPVVQYNQKTIRLPSVEVTRQDIVSGLLNKLIKNMKDTMTAENGIGIAASQIGDNRRVIIITTKKGPEVVFNPVILNKSFRKETIEEGCLSVKGVFGPVARHRQIKVTGLNRHGETIIYQAKGLMARIFQHEVDHLNGTLFIDRAKNISQGSIDLKKWKKRV
ncbi:MAG: peptide deformylase [bacterium]